MKKHQTKKKPARKCAPREFWIRAYDKELRFNAHQTFDESKKYHAMYGKAGVEFVRVREVVPQKPFRWIVQLGRSESSHRNLASAKRHAGKSGKVTPVYKGDEQTFNVTGPEHMPGDWEGRRGKR